MHDCTLGWGGCPKTKVGLSNCTKNKQKIDRETFEKAENHQKIVQNAQVPMSFRTVCVGESIIDGIFLDAYKDGETEELRLRLIDNNSDDILDGTDIGDALCLWW